MSLHPQADVAATYVEDFSPGGDDEPNFNEARDAAYGPQTDSFDSTTYASNTTPETYGMPAANDLLNTAAAASGETEEGGLGNVLEHVGAGIGDQLFNHTGDVIKTAATGVVMLGGVAAAAALAPAVTTLAIIGGAGFAAWKLGEWAFGIADDVAVAWDPNSHSAAEIAEAESNLRGTGAGLTHIIAGSAGGLVAGTVKSAIFSAGKSAVTALENGALRGATGVGDDILNFSDDALGAATAEAAAKKSVFAPVKDAAVSAKDAVVSAATGLAGKANFYVGPPLKVIGSAGKQAFDNATAAAGTVLKPLGVALQVSGRRISRDLSRTSTNVAETVAKTADDVGKSVSDGIASVGQRLKPKPKTEGPASTAADDAKPTTVADGAKPNLWADLISGKKFVDAGNELAGGARNIARVSRVADESFKSLTTPALKYAQAPENAWRVGLIPGTVGATFAYDKSKTSYFDGDNAVATTALHDGGQVKVLGNIVDDSGQPTAALIQNARGETYYAVVEGDDIIARPFALNGHDDPSNYPHIAWANQFSYVDVPANMRVSMI